MSPSSSSLLRLPCSLRRRIYLEAGVVQDRLIELGTRRDCTSKEDMGKLVDLRSTLVLLCTCRAVHDDVFQILYSENTFFLSYCRSGLQPVHRLTSRMLACMTRLDISLRRIVRWTRCHTCTEGCGEYFFTNEEFHKKPLRWKDKQIIDDWHAAAKHIFSNILPSTLTFGLICDTYEFEAGIAERVVEPFLTCPPLRDCKIRLSFGYHEPLAELAKKTASAAAQVQSISIPRCELPDEIVLRILRYTTLLALPTCELEVWSSQGRDYLGQRRYFENLDGHEYHPLHRSRNHFKCNHHILCYCWHHSAWTHDCECWRPPTALFLVCRQWTRVAQEVLLKESGGRVFAEPLTWAVESQNMRSCLLASLLESTFSLKHSLHWLRVIRGMMTDLASLDLQADEDFFSVTMCATKADIDYIPGHQKASWWLDVSFPSKDIITTVHIASARFKLHQEDLPGVGVSTVMSFFPGLELLTGLEHFSLFAMTGFPYVAFHRLSDRQMGEGLQRLPYKLERAFQLFIAHIMEGGSEGSTLAYELEERSRNGNWYAREMAVKIFENWTDA